MDLRIRLLRSLALAALLAGGLASAARAELLDTAAWSQEGTGSFGAALATGDLNCDGKADLVVGTPQASVSSNDDGKVQIWFGDATLPAPQPLGPADWTAFGDAGQRTGFGAALAVGDLDHNGCDDLIVGAPDAVRPRIQIEDRARILVFFSFPGALEPFPSWSATGFGAGSLLSLFGQSVATGDLDGDGIADLIVGEPGAESGSGDEGAVLVWLGGLNFIFDPLGTALNADWTAQSNQSGARLGRSVANAGDVDADGDDEVLAGAPDWDGPGRVDEGSVLLWKGSPAFASTADGTPANAGFHYEHGAAGAHLGASVAGIGDLEADGFADIAFGAPDFDSIHFGPRNGLVLAVRGEAFGPPSGAFDWKVEGNFDQGRLGTSVAPAGDVNGDGRADFLMGAPGPGRVTLHLGSPTWTESQPTGMTYIAALPTFGSVVATAGDWNDDGFSDVVAGAPNPITAPVGSFIGRVLVFLGSGEPVSSAPITTLAVGQPLAGFGLGLGYAGDINHDGFSDVVVGAPNWESEAGHDGEGRIFPFYGGPCAPDCFPLSEIIFPGDREGNQGSAQLGASLAGAGDVNGDGYADVIAGAPGFDGFAFPCPFPFNCPLPDAGQAQVFLGNQNGLSFSANWTAEGNNLSNSKFGWSVSSAGDVNGDGFSDVLVGAPFEDAGATDAGRVFLYLGSATGLASSPSWSQSGTLADARFGISVASAGDVNRDGHSDVIIGADGHGGTGAAFIYLGRPTTPAYPQGLYPNPVRSYFGSFGSSFGLSVASAGDVNRDGFSDVVVGAPTTYRSGFFFEGEVTVYHGGALPSATADTTLHGDPAILNDSRFGSGVAAGGDVDGDGFGDLIVGDQWHSNPTFARGKVYVFHGAEGGVATTAQRTLEDCGEVACDFGRDVAGGHDVNGDGFPDLLAGAFRFNNDEGGVFLHLGNGGLGLGNTLAGIARRPLQAVAFGGPPRALLGAVLDWFEASLDLRSPAGRTHAQLELEVKPLGQDFDGQGTLKVAMGDNVFTPRGLLNFLIPSGTAETLARPRAQRLADLRRLALGLAAGQCAAGARRAGRARARYRARDRRRMRAARARSECATKAIEAGPPQTSPARRPLDRFPAGLPRVGPLPRIEYRVLLVGRPGGLELPVQLDDQRGRRMPGRRLWNRGRRLHRPQPSRPRVRLLDLLRGTDRRRLQQHRRLRDDAPASQSGEHHGREPDRELERRELVRGRRRSRHRPPPLPERNLVQRSRPDVPDRHPPLRLQWRFLFFAGQPVRIVERHLRDHGHAQLGDPPAERRPTLLPRSPRVRLLRHLRARRHARPLRRGGASRSHRLTDAHGLRSRGRGWIHRSAGAVRRRVPRLGRRRPARGRPAAQIRHPIRERSMRTTCRTGLLFSVMLLCAAPTLAIAQPVCAVAPGNPLVAGCTNAAVSGRVEPNLSNSPGEQTPAFAGQDYFYGFSHFSDEVFWRGKYIASASATATPGVLKTQSIVSGRHEPDLLDQPRLGNAYAAGIRMVLRSDHHHRRRRAFRSGRAGPCLAAPRRRLLPGLRQPIGTGRRLPAQSEGNLRGRSGRQPVPVDQPDQQRERARSTRAQSPVQWPGIPRLPRPARESQLGDQRLRVDRRRPAFSTGRLRDPLQIGAPLLPQGKRGRERFAGDDDRVSDAPGATAGIDLRSARRVRQFGLLEWALQCKGKRGATSVQCHVDFGNRLGGDDGAAPRASSPDLAHAGRRNRRGAPAAAGPLDHPPAAATATPAPSRSLTGSGSRTLVHGPASIRIRSQLIERTFSSRRPLRLRRTTAASPATAAHSAASACGSGSGSGSGAGQLVAGSATQPKM